MTLVNTMLPTLSAGLTDEQLRDHIRRNSQIIFNTKDSASKLYDRTLKVDCPQRELRAGWRNFQTRIANARRRGLEAEELRVALEASAFVVSFVTRWENATRDERRNMWTFDTGFGYQGGPTLAPMSPDAVTSPAFNANNFIGELTKRGIRIDAMKGGITAIPADMLTTQDRELIKRHKAAIVEALSLAEVVA